MQCGACGTELLPGARFCHSCGARAALTCAGCGASIGSEFRFCPECGREVAPPTPAAAAGDARDRLGRQIPSELAHKIRAAQGHVEGERKQVTVLFCDLTGSTAIAEQLDPEDYHEILDQYLELAFAEVYRYDGIVNVLAGDGLMALFGAPVAHEDAPQRAVLAALAIQEALGHLHAPVLVERGLALQARIGIHTGPVVVGTVGNDLKMDYTAIGDTTNLAARLEALAAPGSVLVSDATYRLVRGLFRVRASGPLDVRGKREPVLAYEVQGAAEAAMPMAIAAERGLTPFVGRTAELGQLDAAYRRRDLQTAEVVAVVGAAGSGKSRLIYEWKQQLASEPAVVLEGRCSALSQAVPFFPFVTMFRAYFDLGPEETRESAAAKMCARVPAWHERPELTQRLVARLLGLPLAQNDEQGEEHRREAFEAIADLLHAESQRAPLVLVVEDVHVIDDGSRELLQTLIARLANTPLLVVASHRPEGRPRWQARAAFTQIVLRRLPDDDVRTMIRAVAGGVLPTELEDVLVARAEGSPFFAEEITRALVEEGYLVRDNGRRRLTRPIEDLRIPGTVQEVIAARLDRLGPQEKRVVQVAAVLGRQFSARELAGVLWEEGIDVTQSLAELERRGLFHRKHLLGGDDYRFGESLTQEVAYESLLHRQRRQLHERVGHLLEALPSEATSARTALIAHHFARSDNRPKAIAALLHAAEDAERQPSYRTAADFYRQAWDLAEAQGNDGAEPAGRRAALAAMAGFCRVVVLFGLPHVAEAERAAERGRAIAEALGDNEALALLTYFQGALVIGRGRDHFARGLELAEQALAVAERAGLRTAAMRLSRGLCIHYALDGRGELARRTIDWVVEALETNGERERLTDLYVSGRWVRDMVLYLSDDFDLALRNTIDTHALAVRAPNRTVRSGAATTIAQIYFVRGEYAEAKRWADEGLEIAETIGNLSGFPAAAAIALGARLELGEPVAAGRYLERMDQGVAAAVGSQLNVRFVGDALIAVGDRPRLERYAEILRTHPGGRLRESMVATGMGDVLAALGRPDEAECRYREALSLAEAVGARSAIITASLGLAQLAIDRGDEATTFRYRDRARALAQELGLARYVRRADRLGVLETAASA
jgi:class 3 adenylate cyclase/tetratricopeptide (TPR) repeat protein